MPLSPEFVSVYLPAVEAMLFASDRPLAAPEIAQLLSEMEESDIDADAIGELLAAISEKHGREAGGFELAHVAGGWEFRTRPGLMLYARALYRQRAVRLSRAALEVLSIVAYRQPCTKSDVDDVRGVDSASALRQVLERRLIRILGKSDDVGRPILYGTTPEFLALFGLRSLADLPTLREFTELTEEHVVRLQELDATLAANLQGGATGDGQAELPLAAVMPTRQGHPGLAGDEAASAVPGAEAEPALDRSTATRIQENDDA